MRLLVTSAACLVLGLVVGGGVAAPAAPACKPTANDGSGPFGRGAPPRRAKTGTGHVLTGLVLSSVDCRPLARARVHLWQANRRGDYLPAASATVVTDAAGRFRYESRKPVSYEGRSPHIHLRVVADKHEILFSRYVPASARASRGSVRLVLLPQGV